MQIPAAKILVILAATVCFGCDGNLNKTRSADSADSKNTPSQRIAELNQQNAELIQMLEEAESKLNGTLQELEQTKQALTDTTFRLQTVETESAAALNRLDLIAGRVAEIRSEFSNKMADTAEQFESLIEMMPARSPQVEPQQDIVADEKNTSPETDADDNL